MNVPFVSMLASMAREAIRADLVDETRHPTLEAPIAVYGVEANRVLEPGARA